MNDASTQKPLNGWWVFAAFATFFGVIIVVNTVFITQALKSHSGLVTEDAYKKGLSYNETLKQARSQPKMQSEVRFKDGTVSWTFKTPLGENIEGANVSAKFTRPVKDGNDFSASMLYEGEGIYTIKPEFPFKGIWNIQLSAAWNNQIYKTTNEIIVK